MTRYELIPGHPCYRVGDDGTVWSCRPNRHQTEPKAWMPLSPVLERRGLRVHLSGDNGKTYYFNVGALVLQLFVGPRPAKHVVKFLNGDKSDNRVENLAWASRFKTKEPKPYKQLKITNEAASAIRAAWKTGKVTGRELAAQYHTTSGYISHIVNGRRR